jgi:tetratricopeptide (TPR) repeat protein
MKEGEFEPTLLRGRRLDKAKIERWRKREGMVGSGSHVEYENSPGESHYPLFRVLLIGSEGLVNGNSGVSDDAHLDFDPMDLDKEDGNVEEMSRHQEQRRETPGCQETFNPWLCVDVIGSPGLTGLIGALTLEVCEDIPDLNLSESDPEELEEDQYNLRTLDESCGVALSSKAQKPPRSFKPVSSSVSFGIALMSRDFPRPRQQYMPGPLDELYPLPRSVPKTRISVDYIRTNHLLSTSLLKTKEIECRTKFKSLKNTERSAMMDLVNDMQSIAWRHYELDQFTQSEAWWRRVVSLSLQIQDYDFYDVFRACLWIIDNLHWQGKLTEALQLHHAVHSKISNLLEPEHQLVMLSKNVLSSIWRSLGDSDSEISIARELVQIYLCSFGTNSRDAVRVIGDLGIALGSCGRYQEAEALLSIAMQLEWERSQYENRTLLEAYDATQLMGLLAKWFRKQGKYGEVKAVLGAMERRFGDVISSGSSPGWLYLQEKAQLLRIEGNQVESEKILRSLLERPPDYYAVDICNVLLDLAELLTENDRQEEAATSWEKRLSIFRKRYGIEHRLTISACEDLGFCYADLERYDDAIGLFQQTIEELALIQDGDPQCRDSYIEQLRDRILFVEETREEAG